MLARDSCTVAGADCATAPVAHRASAPPTVPNCRRVMCAIVLPSGSQSLERPSTRLETIPAPELIHTDNQLGMQTRALWFASLVHRAFDHQTFGVLHHSL